ncbi:neuromedin-U isoform X4 [Cottoperca gobio]|uniref:Neuromedin-U isoform X4 n=1 Tax=Cottoperca gobio TaxID=56716 RepID=A0A6J2PL38_COTGO|nr:neuromedin-U isoform X4 [Cottoperca gobio]
MRTFQSQSQAAQRGASSSLHSLSSTASIALTALLILTIPVCTSAPAELQQATTGQRQILSQIDAVCSSYLSADLKIWASDVLGELCVLMLFQKSKELKVQENSKRAEVQGPGGIQSRGYFLYRPRNGRRSLEYE